MTLVEWPCQRCVPVRVAVPPCDGARPARGFCIRPLLLSKIVSSLLKTVFALLQRVQIIWTCWPPNDVQVRPPGQAAADRRQWRR